MRDPLKYYFQEKAAGLFLRKEVMRVFIEEGNRERGQIVNHIENATNGFPKESDSDEEGPCFTLKKPLPLNEDEVIQQYLNEKQTKKHECWLMMKLNEEMVVNHPSFELKDQMNVYDKNEVEFTQSLSEQFHSLQSRINSRRSVSLLNRLIIR